jgi:hypothetical protein
VEFFGGVQSLVYLVLLVASLGVKGYAVFDALRRPADAFPYAGKLSKPAWLGITGVALAVNVVLLNPLQILNVVGVVAAIVYIVDVRPAVSQYRAGGGGGYGPYGPY